MIWILLANLGRRLEEFALAQQERTELRPILEDIKAAYVPPRLVTK